MSNATEGIPTLPNQGSEEIPTEGETPGPEEEPTINPSTRAPEEIAVEVEELEAPVVGATRAPDFDPIPPDETL